MDKKEVLLDLYELELYKKSLYEEDYNSNTPKENREHEFATAIKSSELAWNWCCHDEASELCDNNCVKCMAKFEEQIDEITKSVKEKR